jgi:hypothetical protein
MVSRPPAAMGTVRQLGSQLWLSRALKLPLEAACACRGGGGAASKGRVGAGSVLVTLAQPSAAGYAAGRRQG